MQKDNDQKQGVSCKDCLHHASFFPWCILKERIVDDKDSCRKAEKK